MSAHPSPTGDEQRRDSGRVLVASYPSSNQIRLDIAQGEEGPVLDGILITPDRALRTAERLIEAARAVINERERANCAAFLAMTEPRYGLPKTTRVRIADLKEGSHILFFNADGSEAFRRVVLRIDHLQAKFSITWRKVGHAEGGAMETVVFDGKESLAVIG